MTRETLLGNADLNILVVAVLTAVLQFAVGFVLLGLAWTAIAIIHLLGFEWDQNPERYPDTVTENRDKIIAGMLLITLAFLVVDLVLLLAGGV